ncbi:Frag1/DRAM/Sfk1 family-domain-containing protein [Aspergillus karnatakaensis]|uniref:Frag1/DRAM/Sfk1 family protein n=1 Tax=Aspergillus karnatakaensis TaxID=1810916 RepID=UPI003CCCC72C
MWIVSFWIFPVISACMWIAMLAAMFGNWAIQGYPRYVGMEDGQTIAYISDIGAEGLQPLFIAGSAVTVVFLDLSFIAERWLRHAGQLVPNKGWLDKSAAILSILFSIAGAAGLILLSIFDTVNHNRLHGGFLAMFLVAYLVSAILICVEYLRIGIVYRSQHRVLFASFIIKAFFVVVEIALAIAFGICGWHEPHHRNAAAVLEWVIAIVFTFYVLSFVIDLLPSVRTRRHVPQGEKVLGSPHSSQPEMVYEEPLTHDSAGPNANHNAGYYRGVNV